MTETTRLTRNTKVAPQTVRILQALLKEEIRVKRGGSPAWGFRTQLSIRYGVTRARISNIAKRFGLTNLAHWHPGENRKATGRPEPAPKQ